MPRTTVRPVRSMRSMRPTALIVAATLLGVAGCTVGPRYKRPALTLPNAWRISADESSSIANEKWWELLKDPVLQQLIRTALTHNTDIRIAAAQVLQAQAQVMVTRSAQFPQISLDPSVERQRSVDLESQSSATSAATFNAFTLSGGISYAVDFWGLYRRATEEARATLLATEQARKNVIIGVVSSVAQDYFQLRTFDLELQQTQASATAYRDSLNLTQSLFGAGVQSELDVKQAQTALQTALAEIPAIEQQMGQEEDALSLLLGQNPATIPRGISIDRQPLPPAVPAGLPSQLLERRPDILEAEETLAASYAAVGVATAQFFPQLTLTGAGGTQSNVLSQIASTPSLIWSLAGSVTQPIFTGGRLRGNLQAARAQQQQALVSYEQAVLIGFQEVNDALIAYQRSKEQLTAQETLVEAEQDALHLSNLRYQGGVDTYLNVLTAEESLLTGQITLAQDRNAVWAALVQLYQSLGGGWRA